MSERWLRLYEGVVNDPKLQRLPGETFKGLINLWCIASSNGGALPPVEDMAFTLRMTETKVEALLETLRVAGLLDEDETGIRPHNWNGRQYKSDVSTARVKRHRERKNAVARNVDETLHETPPDTDTDTEAETERESNARARPISPDWKPKDPKADPAEVKRFVNHHLAAGTECVNWEAKWEVWLSRIADFGKAKPLPPEAVPAADMTWISEDDPRFGMFAGRSVTEFGRRLIPRTSRHEIGPGEYVPTAWLTDKAAA